MDSLEAHHLLHDTILGDPDCAWNKDPKWRHRIDLDFHRWIEYENNILAVEIKNTKNGHIFRVKTPEHWQEVKKQIQAQEMQ
jgi:hypothetical protein